MPELPAGSGAVRLAAPRERERERADERVDALAKPHSALESRDGRGVVARKRARECEKGVPDPESRVELHRALAG